MYLDFFRLKEFPFSIASDEKYFYESEIHAEALANMLYTIQQRKGMVLVTGEVGSGKTFLGSMLANRLGKSAVVGNVRTPPDSAKQMLRAVAESIGIRVTKTDDKLSLASELEQKLERHLRRGRLVSLILDEVQDLPDEAMEQIRLMWNWEADGQRMLQIVLIGQPELRDRLREPKWESLQQRIVLSYHLGNLTPADTARYVLHRRRIAARDGSELRFTITALEDIHEITKGIPRLINVLCDNALLTAYAQGSQKITSSIVSKVVNSMTTWSLRPGQDESGDNGRG
jgi:general secretion pathway protein A